MRAGRRVIAGTVAFVLLIASLAGLWRVLVENADIRLTGEMLTSLARNHPPKPWRGFEIEILSVSVDREVHIKAHVSGHMIHTPVEVSGAPEYDANARAIFFHVSKARLPQDTARPMLSRFNAMLSPLGTYIAQDLTDVIPTKRIKPETRGGAMFVTTVKSVRVDGDVVVVEIHGYHVAAATVALTLCALLSAAWLLALLLRALPSRKR
jgi:hypothetical protein